MAEQQRRSNLTLGHRLDAALRRARLVSEAPAGDLERRSPSAESDEAGPRDSRGLMFQPGHDSLADYFEWRFRVLIENFEREVDAARLRPLVGVAGDESTEDRDARLLEYKTRGLSPREILLVDPAQGSVQAIVRAYARIQKAEEK
jgi:hypothetical protein